MTTEEIIALAKEKFGQEITRVEAEDYLSGKKPIPDEALEQISGGALCLFDLDERVEVIYMKETKCPVCGLTAYAYSGSKRYECDNCEMNFAIVEGSIPPTWEIRKTCQRCRCVNTFYLTEDQIKLKRMHRCNQCTNVLL